ncbi:IMPACT family protein [Sediminibacterium soli]|uniref:IMPACT family protein n=1 Tax=Sediminibacterium soli TaxID=2698829 RepID=UPI0013797304|nr:YigZ family protein [Sediminibacterium soli]NCI47135.1 YigZ family protein [Sediminibacterium soli]
MSEAVYFQTIDKESFAEYKDRGSRFLAYAYPVSSADDCKALLQRSRKEHPKAVHHCFAWRIGYDGNQFRQSDDGEPSGTAGKPILGQIDSRQLTDVMIIVVRYFGGTLLGVPGLIQAYRSAAAMALQLIPVVQKPIEAYYHLQFDYTQVNDVMNIVKQYNCSIQSQEMQLFCLLTIGIPKARMEEALYKFRQMHTLDIKKTDR